MTSLESWTPFMYILPSSVVTTDLNVILSHVGKAKNEGCVLRATASFSNSLFVGIRILFSAASIVLTSMPVIFDSC